MPLTYLLNPGGASYSIAFNSCDTGNITIPDTFGGLPVVGINQDAFLNCTTLTGIIISNNVTGIGESAFRGCSNLTGYKMSENLIYLGPSGFMNCTNLSGALIPTGINEIYSSTFRACTSISSLQIPNNIKNINDNAFRDCTKIEKDVFFPRQLTGINEFAFRGCNKVSKFYFPRSIDYLGSSGFYGCTNLSGAYFLGNPPRITGQDIFIFNLEVVGGNTYIYRHMYLEKEWYNRATGFQGKRIASIEDFNENEIKSNIFEFNGNTGIVEIVATGSKPSLLRSKNFDPNDIPNLSIWINSSNYTTTPWYIPSYVDLYDVCENVPSANGVYYENYYPYGPGEGTFYYQDGGPNYIEYLTNTWFLYDDTIGDYVASISNLQACCWDDYGYGACMELMDYDYYSSYWYDQYTFYNQARNKPNLQYTNSFIISGISIISKNLPSGKIAAFIRSLGLDYLTSNEYIDCIDFTIFFVVANYRGPGVGNSDGTILFDSSTFEEFVLGRQSAGLPLDASCPIRYRNLLASSNMLTTSYKQGGGINIFTDKKPAIVCMTRKRLSTAGPPNPFAYRFYIETSDISSPSTRKREVFIDCGVHNSYGFGSSLFTIFSDGNFNTPNNTDAITDMFIYSRNLNDAEISTVFNWLRKKYEI